MVHDACGRSGGAGEPGFGAGRFDEQRLVSDAGLLVTATLAERLGIEELVNESVWLGPRAAGRGAAGPQGDVAGARDARRRGQHRSDERAARRVDRPDPRAPGDGALDARDVPARVHVRARPPARPRPGCRARARVGGRRGPGRWAVGDRHRQLHRRGPRRSEAGRRPTGTPASSAITRSSRSAPIPARCCTSATARARPTRSAAPRGSSTSCSPACAAPGTPARS